MRVSFCKLSAVHSFEAPSDSRNCQTLGVSPAELEVYSCLIISSISQLERDLIRERVINGLRAAKERGVKIGRKKTRPSALIRRLRSKGLTYSEIARLANCSQGSVSVEIKLWQKEKADGSETLLESEDISDELLEETIRTSREEKEEPTPTPVPVVRY